jgi:hypothetical protein
VIRCLHSFKPGWWFRTWILFLHILGIIVPTDFHIFHGGLKPPTRNTIEWFSDVFGFCFLKITIRWVKSRAGQESIGNKATSLSLADEFPQCLSLLELGEALGRLASTLGAVPLGSVSITIPRCSMSGIFTYIWVIFRANVGKYSIHGASGIVNKIGEFYTNFYGLWPCVISL